MARDGNDFMAGRLPDHGAAIQGVFDFATGNADGHANWLRERETCFRKIEQEWQVPIGKRVSLSLRNVDGSFEGRLELAEEPPKIDRHVPLSLRLGTVTFTDRDIESCVLMENDA